MFPFCDSLVFSQNLPTTSYQHIWQLFVFSFVFLFSLHAQFSYDLLATCKCPNIVFLNWFENRPYVIKAKPDSIEGIFAQIITDTIDSSCGLCNGRKTVISTFRSLSGESPEKDSELALKSAIGKEYHISFPVRGKVEMAKYLGVHAFVAVVQSTGIATVVRNEVDRTAKTKAAFVAMFTIWPMYAIIVLTTLLAGIVIWYFVSIHAFQYVVVLR